MWCVMWRWKMQLFRCGIAVCFVFSPLRVEFARERTWQHMSWENDKRLLEPRLQHLLPLLSRHEEPCELPGTTLRLRLPLKRIDYHVTLR